jgi:hypothetical protein
VADTTSADGILMRWRVYWDCTSNKRNRPFRPADGVKRSLVELPRRRPLIIMKHQPATHDELMRLPHASASFVSAMLRLGASLPQAQSVLDTMRDVEIRDVRRLQPHIAPIVLSDSNEGTKP